MLWHHRITTIGVSRVLILQHMLVATGALFPSQVLTCTQLMDLLHKSTVLRGTITLLPHTATINLAVACHPLLLRTRLHFFTECGILSIHLEAIPTIPDAGLFQSFGTSASVSIAQHPFLGVHFLRLGFPEQPVCPSIHTELKKGRSHLVHVDMRKGGGFSGSYV